jgi:hypothetical protein
MLTTFYKISSPINTRLPLGWREGRKDKESPVYRVGATKSRIKKFYRWVQAKLEYLKKNLCKPR